MRITISPTPCPYCGSKTRQHRDGYITCFRCDTILGYNPSLAELRRRQDYAIGVAVLCFMILLVAAFYEWYRMSAFGG